MTILAATDFSPCSVAATRLAVAMARRRKAPLILLHTIEPLAVDPGAVPMSGIWEAGMATAAEQALASQADEFRKSGVVIEVQVQFGSPARSILDTAASSKADLIVLGTHGRKGAERLFLGSCAEEVVRSASCPVLVTAADPAKLGRWEGTAPLRLAVVTDGSSASESAFSWVRTSGDGWTNDVSLVRVYWPPQEAAHYGLEDPWRAQEGHPELIRLLKRDLHRDARSLIGAQEPHMRFIVASHDAGNAIAGDVRNLSADAMVIGVPAHRRSTSTGLTPASVLRSAPVPVFCIPERGHAKERHIPKIHSVLIASDLSEASLGAILPAYGLLLGGGRAELLYVHPRGTGSALDGLPTVAALNDDERSTIEARLRAATPPEAAEHGITTHVSVVDGSLAADAILQAAERLDVDVIAIGSHGRSGVKRAVLGSIAEQVSRLSPRPVLIVRGLPR